MDRTVSDHRVGPGSLRVRAAVTCLSMIFDVYQEHHNYFDKIGCMNCLWHDVFLITAVAFIRILHNCMYHSTYTDYSTSLYSTP
jgi:hypothetical protein